MENKLQELTQKLYEEGLSKGRIDADNLVEQAKTQSDKIIKDAKDKADAIVRAAQQSAQELRKNTQTEVVLASRQIVATLKQQIEGLILTKNITPAINAAIADTTFVKEVILAVVKNWGGNNDVKIVLPEQTSMAVESEITSAVASTLNSGLELTLSGGVKSGFKIGPKDGSYYISFTDADFDALFKEFLRPKVAELLYTEK